jgi:hypothetical protein
MILNSPTISGSLTVTGNIITSGSITLSGSVASASYAATASFVALAQSASNAVSAQTASFANAFTVASTLTAQTLVVQTITSSVDFVTGSTRFGSLASNTHQFTGSMYVTGAFYVTTGSVGIGTSSPNSTLQVLKSGATFQVTDTGKTANNTFSVYGYSQTSWAIATGNSGSFSGGEKIIINDNGNIGIGTTPTYPIHIGSNYANAGSISSGGDLYGTVYFGQSGLIVGTQSTTGNTALITYGTNKDILFGSWNGSSNSEKMRVRSDGTVLIGKTTTGMSSNGTQLVSNGEIYISITNTANTLHVYDTTNSAYRFYVGGNGGISNYQANNTNLSDERTKKDIIPLESYWDKFKDIEIVKFKYKDQTHDDFNIGVIAQQVEEIAPEFIDIDGFGETPEDGIPFKTVYTSDLHHATIKVLQEAMAKIETLEAQNDALQSQINELKAK